MLEEYRTIELERFKLNIEKVIDRKDCKIAYYCAHLDLHP